MEKKMKTTIAYWGYIGIVKKENGNYRDYSCYIKVGVLGLFWSYIGIVKRKMETMGIIGV